MVHARFYAALVLTLGLGQISSANASPFKNLDFEQYTLSSPAGDSDDPFPFEETAQLANWTDTTSPLVASQWDGPSGLVGPPIVTPAVIEAFPGNLDSTGVELVGLYTFDPSSGTYSLTPNGQAIQGNVSVDLYGVNFEVNNPAYQEPSTASISQRGTVPFNAKSIQFETTFGAASGGTDIIGSTPYLSFAGNTINLSALSQTGAVTTWIGDVSEYAGTTGSLSFSATPLSLDLSSPFNEDEDEYTLDAISFSAQAAPTPEPSSWVLGMTSCAFLVYLRSRQLKGSFQGTEVKAC